MGKQLVSRKRIAPFAIPCLTKVLTLNNSVARAPEKRAQIQADRLELQQQYLEMQRGFIETQQALEGEWNRGMQLRNDKNRKKWNFSAI